MAQKVEAQAAPASAEQAADFAALQAAAAEQGPAPGQVAPEAEAPAGPAPASASALQAAAMLVGILRPVVGFLVPALKAAPVELWEPIPEGIAGLLDHYGIGESELMANPWMRAGLSAAPLIVYAVMQSEKKPEPEKARAVTVTAGTVVPGEAPAVSKVVTVGTVIPGGG